MNPPTALITGAGSGIGRAFAIALAQRGYRLFLVDIDERGLEETVALQQLERADRTRYVVDISRADLVQQLALHLGDKTAELSLLVNCAGILGAGSFLEQPTAAFARVIQVNLMGTVLMVHTLAPMLSKARGHVINMASTASLHGWPMLAAYSAAKGALENFSEAVRPELEKQHIGLTTVFPLLVDTPMLQNGETPPILRGRRVTAQEVVNRALDAAENEDARLFVPRLARAVALVHGLSPPALDWWGSRFGFARESRS